MKTEKTLTVLRRVLKALILIIVGVILLANLYCLVAGRIFKVKAPTVFGCSSAVVLTGSMSGTIEPDDFIITHKQSDYTVGDIVMYQTGGTPVTHRIISENEKGYRTKGDANNTDDGTEIPKEDIVGKVVLVIPKIGAVVRLARTPIGMLSLFAAIILIAELPNLIGYIRRKGKNRKTEKTRGRENETQRKNRTKAEIPASFFRRFALSSADCGGGVRRDLFKICDGDNGGRYGKSGNYAGYYRYRNRKFCRNG